MVTPMLDESRSPAMPAPVAATFAAFPEDARRALEAAREEVFAVAAGT
jgi:hypothetical protein